MPGSILVGDSMSYIVIFGVSERIFWDSTAGHDLSNLFFSSSVLRCYRLIVVIIVKQRNIGIP
jgi:hypothetical protein